MTNAPPPPTTAAQSARTILTRLHEVMASRTGAQGKLNQVVGIIGECLHSERSEEHTSELQSLMRTSYAVFCLKQNKNSLPNAFSSHSKSINHHLSIHNLQPTYTLELSHIIT